MSMPQYAVSIIWGSVGGSAVLAALVGIFGRRWVDGALAKKKAGYSKELADLQAQYAQKLEAIKAEIDRSIFVTNVHFETEFDALKRTFGAATDLKYLVLALRPVFDIVPEDPTSRKGRKAETLLNCMNAYNVFSSAYDNLSPFYPEDIYTEFQKCAQAANQEIAEVRLGIDDMSAHGWRDQARENQDKFVTAYNAASELIRQRISSLAVAGRTAGH